MENNKKDNVGFAVMLSGNCQAGQLLGVVDADLAGIHYDTNMDPPDNYQTTYDSKTNIVVFYSLSNACMSTFIGGIIKSKNKIWLVDKSIVIPLKVTMVIRNLLNDCVLPNLQSFKKIPPKSVFLNN